MAKDWESTVQGLINKAERTHGTPESAAFLEKAMYLMAKYGIEDAQLRKKDGVIERATYEHMLIGSPYSFHKANLLATIANYLGGQAVSQTGSNYRKIWLFGFKDDIARIKMLYFSLLAQQHLEISVAMIPQGENAKAFRSAFFASYNSTIDNRLSAIYNKVQKEPGNAIAIRDREQDVKDAINEKFDLGVREDPRRISVSSNSGIQAGREAGSRADLGQTRVGQ